MFFDRWKSVSSSATSQESGHAREFRESHGRHVLLVTSSADANSVLQTVLERKGMTTTSVLRAEEGLRSALAESPGVIVLDDDVVPTAARAIEFLAVSDTIGSELIVLGKLPGSRIALPEWIEIAKPYHYGTLICKIESRLLGRMAA